MYVTLSFYTMVKSSTPIWVLLFSFIFGFEKPRVRLVAIIGLMVVGVILTVEGETKFDMVGFLLVLVAAVVSGLRWNLTQFLLQEDRLGMDNPIATLYHLSPIMFVIMLLLSLIFENPIDQFKESEHFDSIFHVMESFGLMSIGGFLGKWEWHTFRDNTNFISSICNDFGRIILDQEHQHCDIERGWHQQRDCHYFTISHDIWWCFDPQDSIRVRRVSHDSSHDSDYTVLTSPIW